MNDELKILEKEVIESHDEYKKAAKQYTELVEQEMQKQKLSLDKEEDIDKIVDLEMKIDETHSTELSYKKWTKKADEYIFKNFEFLLNKFSKDPRIKTIIELKQILSEDQSKIIIYRERLLKLFNVKVN